MYLSCVSVGKTFPKSVAGCCNSCHNDEDDGFPSLSEFDEKWDGFDGAFCCKFRLFLEQSWDVKSLSRHPKLVRLSKLTDPVQIRPL